MFYKKLYSQQKIDNIDRIDLFLESLNLTRVKVNQNKALAAEIMVE